MLVSFYLSVLLTSIHTSLCVSSLRSKLYHHEILTPRHIVVRVKKEANGMETRKELNLSIFGQEVSLSLAPGLPKSLLSSDAKFEMVQANGTKSRINLDLNDFHHGVIQGLSDSLVDAFYHEGLWTIQAVHPTLSFSVEPLDYHTGIDSNQQMVAYRHRDIRPALSQSHKDAYRSAENLDNKHLAGMKKTRTKPYKSIIQPSVLSEEIKIAPDDPHDREKRETSTLKVCDVLAIADYTFYDGVGAKSDIKTAKLLINVFTMANSIFVKTKFESTSANSVGIKLRGATVYTHKANPLGFEEVVKDNKRYIQLMTKEAYFSEYCLVHISTQRFFQGHALSSAHTARMEDNMNGICGSHNNHSGNVGYSTVLHENAVLPLTSYKLVVSHELGHNFGASHDGTLGASHPECVPGDKQGGKFLMWYQTLTGFNPNNFKFSPCSIRSINKILKRRPNCLVPRNSLEKSTCGNGIIDYGEDCDSGTLLQEALNKENDCCRDNCRFKPAAICSPLNHPCCQNCTVAPRTRKCAQKIEHPCSEESFCDGVHFESCPPLSAKPNGQVCMNKGECQNGLCINYCSVVGLSRDPPEPLERCACEMSNNSCTMCCRGILGNQPCLPTEETYDDDTPCLWGFCKNGTCKKADPVDADDQLTSKFRLLMVREEARRTEAVKTVTLIVALAVCVLVVCVGITCYISDNFTLDMMSGS